VYILKSSLEQQALTTSEVTTYSGIDIYILLLLLAACLCDTDY